MGGTKQQKCPIWPTTSPTHYQFYMTPLSAHYVVVQTLVHTMALHYCIHEQINAITMSLHKLTLLWRDVMGIVC